VSSWPHMVRSRSHYKYSWYVTPPKRLQSVRYSEYEYLLSTPIPAKVHWPLALVPTSSTTSTSSTQSHVVASTKRYSLASTTHANSMRVTNYNTRELPYRTFVPDTQATVPNTRIDVPNAKELQTSVLQNSTMYLVL
jgi:hypothetical protein